MSDGFDAIDYGDLADIVQQLRMICFRAYLGPAMLGIHVPWFKDIEEFPPYIAEIRMLCSSGDARRAEEARIILDEMKRLHAALLAGPSEPSADEVVARYIGGEIGDRTAK